MVELWQRAGVRLTAHQDWLEVTLCSPENRNAQDPRTWRALAEVAAEVSESTRVVVLNAIGPSFCAGLNRNMMIDSDASKGGPQADHETLVTLVRHDDDTIDRFIQHAQAAFTWWTNTPAITIASVQGHAIGAGFQLALACDLIIAAEDAQFAMRETSLGIVPDLGGTWPLVRKVGYSKALDICATGRVVTAEEALTIGLVERVTNADQLESATQTWRAELSAAPAGAVKDLKALLRAAEVNDRGNQLRAERMAQLKRLRAF
jgi:enoyl-CoA hydratase/carnithine racemase